MNLKNNNLIFQVVLLIIYYIYSVFPVPVGMFVFHQFGADLIDSQGIIPLYYIAGFLPITICLIVLLLLLKATFFTKNKQLDKQTVRHYQNIPYLLLLGAFFGLFYRVIGEIFITGESTGRLSDIYTTQTGIMESMGFAVTSFLTTFLRKDEDFSTNTNTELLYFVAINLVVITIVGCLLIVFKTIRF